jgi:hypothetical protein
MHTLEQSLLESDPARLEAIGHQWGVKELPGHRKEAAVALAARMLSPKEMERTWAALSSSEQAALAALHAAEGKLPWPTFTRRWGQVRAMGPGRIARERPWEKPTSPAEGLWYRGLIFRAVVEGPAGLHEVALIPDDLRANLPTTRTAPAFHPEPTGVPPIVHPAGDHLLDDICTLLAYLQNHRVRPGRGRKWPAQDESRLTCRLRDPAPDRSIFLRHLADRLGWLRTDRSGHLRPRANLVTTWLQDPIGEQRATLARAWLDDPTWNDLWHVPSLHPEDTGSWHNDPLLARQATFRHLAACKPGEWYDLAAFTTTIRECDPDFQRPDGNYSTWYIQDAVTGAYLSGFESWNAVEGALIHYLIAGPIAWLGLVDLGSAYEGTPPSAFRLSPAGAVFLGAGDPPEKPETIPPLTIRPDLSILVPAARRYERFQLSRVADWVCSDDPYIYRLTPTSLERARQQRIKPERVASFLEQATEGNVPHALKAALDRWSRRGTEVWLEQGLLLRVEDEQLLQDIAAAPATRSFIREVVGPKAVLVAPADWPRLARALAARGLLLDLPEKLALPDPSEDRRNTPEGT